MDIAAGAGAGGQLVGSAGRRMAGTGSASVGVAHDLPTVALENAARFPRWDEPAMVPSQTPRTPSVTGTADSRSIAARLEAVPAPVGGLGGKGTSLPPVAETTDTPACSAAQRVGAQGRLVMRSVGLDLGVRHIAICEVVRGEVVARTTVHSLKELEGRLGPGTPRAQVAFEACREGWHVHDMMEQWGHEAHMLDTTRVRQIGVGHHGRKNDAIDAEAIAKALDAGRIPIAHLLSPARRALRAKLSVRGELVDMRARQVTLLRGLARAKGVRLPSSSTAIFLRVLDQAELDDETRSLMAPLVATLTTAEEQLGNVDEELAQIAKADPAIQLCATVPGIAVIVAATFVSVIDEAKRFRNAHAVSAYLGLVPGETTTGGKQRLGGITKQGNSHARRMLVEAAWQILRTEKPDEPLYRWASHIAETRGKRIAIVALARKMSGILWAIWRDGTVYDAEFAARKSAAGLTAAAENTAHRVQALAHVARKIHARERTAKRAKALVLARTPRTHASKGVAM